MFGSRLVKALAILILTSCLAVRLSAEGVTAETFGFQVDASASVIQILQQVEGTRDIPTAVAALKKLPSKSRWVGATRGDVVTIYSFHHWSDENKRHASVSVDEVARALHVADQLGDLMKVESGLRSAISGGTEEFMVSKTDYILKEVRATLTIKGKVEKGSAGPGTAAPKPASWIVVLDFTAGGSATDATEASFVATTGPREPWSISANVPLKSSSDVKLNSDSTGIALKEAKPASFYVGFDYTFGDVLSTPKTFSEAATIKVLLKGSRAPLDSYGAAFALRGGFWSEIVPKLNVLHIFDTVTPFIGLTRTRVSEDAKDAGGTLIQMHGRSTDILWGLSFDIKNAIDWVQKPAANTNTEKK
jgi:hypothetical protein